MARRYSASQIRSTLRQAQQKRQQAITKCNDAVRRYNQGVRTAVNRYNQAVRSHNERVRANRRRLASELARLNSKPTITTASYAVYHTSVQTLQRSYGRLETSADSQQLDARYNRLLDLSEREAANSAEVTNCILGDQPAAAGSVDELEDAELLDRLRGISTDLDDRWNGAVFSLNPQNSRRGSSLSVRVQGKSSRRFSSWRRPTLTSSRYCRIATGHQTALPRVVPRLGTSWPAETWRQKTLSSSSRTISRTLYSCSMSSIGAPMGQPARSTSHSWTR